MDEWGPERIVCVSDRRTGMRGVLVIDNTARGTGKGGTRMSPTVSVGEVARLARTMTWKWAAVDLFHGGAKAGILFDPHAANKEDALRAFARELADQVPERYVFGLDMGLAEADAAIFVDELDSRGVSTGLPRALGGTPYDVLGVTGYGVAEVVDAAAEYQGIDLKNSRIVIQGFGAVGSHTARRLVELGATIVGVSNVHGTLADPDGLNIPQLLTLREEHGDDGITKYGRQLQGVDATITLDADILIPAAQQDTLNEAAAQQITAKLIVEGANLPTNPASRNILAQRGIAVVPDFIANAGGIIAAAFSMDMRYSPFTVDESKIFPMVSEKLRTNAVSVLASSVETGTVPHIVAQQIAQDRVREAMQLRGQWRPDNLWAQEKQ